MRSGTTSFSALGASLFAAALPTWAFAAPTLDNPDRRALTNTAAAARIVDLARARRIDFAIIGDSNVRLGAAQTGHEDAMARALAARFTMYATRVDPADTQVWWGGTWTDNGTWCESPPMQYFGGPTQVRAACFTDWSFPASYAYAPPGATAEPRYNAGCSVGQTSPLNISDPLRYHLTHWRFGPGTTGFFNLCVRNILNGNPVLAALPTVFTAAPTPVFEDLYLDVPAGPRDPSGIMSCITNAPAAAGAIGPICLTYNRFENLSRPTGIAYSPLWFHGGYSSYDTCASIRNDLNAPAASVEWFRQATRLQGAAPVLVVHIMHGGNDINDTRPSLGDIGGLPSNTPAGHEDNIRFIITSLRTWWVNAGNDAANLFFLLGPYHPRTDETDKQAGFEGAWADLATADPQVLSIAGTQLSTPDEILNRGWRITPDDPFHLSAAGYAAWANATARVLMLNHCPADFNESGTQTVQDLFTFLTAYFAQSPTADVNYSGTVTVQDVFEFLRLYFAGCG